MCKNVVIGGFFLGLILICIPSFGQTTVTGHVFAEIVEGVGVSSRTNNNIELQQNSPLVPMDLGEISISGGASTTCAVLISTTTLESENGNLIDFEADTQYRNLAPVLNQNGQQVFKLEGSAGDEIFSKEEKAYAAKYNVIFAYN